MPWEGQSKDLTSELEGFALTLMQQKPIRRAAAIPGTSGTTFWRLLLMHVALEYGAYDPSDFGDVAVDEMNRSKGHRDLTVFADLATRRIVFATEGNDHTTFGRFTGEILRHTGHAKVISQVAMAMSKAYRNGADENLPNAEISLDYFHVIALANDALDEPREVDKSTLLKTTSYLFRKAPASLIEEQGAPLRHSRPEAPGRGPSLQDEGGTARHLPAQRHQGEGSHTLDPLDQLVLRQVPTDRSPPLSLKHRSEHRLRTATPKRFHRCEAQGSRLWKPRRHDRHAIHFPPLELRLQISHTAY